MHAYDLLKKIESLPPDRQQEVEDFVDFLSSKTDGQKAKPQFTWAGALCGLKDEYSAVDLQHKVAEERSEYR